MPEKSKKMEMEKIESKNGYDFYIGIAYCEPVYNIVPAGSQLPAGGYYSKEYIENIKGVKFNKA
jgi:hypothetical protein